MASLRAKVETAFKAVLENADISPVYAGFSDGDKAGLCVIVAARRAEEDPAFSGNYRVTVDIHTKGPPDALALLDATALAVRTTIWQDGLAESLTAQANFTVFGGSAPNVMEWSQIGDTLIETLTVEIYCTHGPLTEA